MTRGLLVCPRERTFPNPDRPEKCSAPSLSGSLLVVLGKAKMLVSGIISLSVTDAECGWWGLHLRPGWSGCGAGTPHGIGPILLFLTALLSPYF